MCTNNNITISGLGWMSASILDEYKGFAVNIYTLFCYNSNIGYIYKLGTLEGIKEETLSKAELFPNPFKNTTTISLNPDINIAGISINIYNSLGQEINIIPLINNNKLIIDLSRYSNGIYYLIIRDNSNIIQSNKLVKY